MKNQNAFLRQISKNGLYIILFLCVTAVGISGYVMYRSQEEIPISEPIDDVQLEPVFDEYIPIEVTKPEIEEEKEPEISKKEEPSEIVMKTEPEFVTAVEGKVISAFSVDKLVKNEVFGDWRVHSGIDIAADEGSEVCAITDGVVSDVRKDDMMGYTVVIEHADDIISTYCNLMEGIVVKKGDTVNAGDVIGGVGKSAIAESNEDTHLHLEVTKNGEQIDPMSLIK